MIHYLDRFLPFRIEVILVRVPNLLPKASEAGNLSNVDPATPLPAFAQRVTIVLYQFIDNRSEYENVTTNQYPKLKSLVDFVTTTP